MPAPRLYAPLRLTGLLILAIFGLAFAARASEPIAVAPYEVTEDGALSIKTMINGAGPYDFIIDTGSTLTLIFENMRGAGTFLPTGGAPRRILSISGARQFDPVAIGDVSVGGATLSDHVGVILPDWPAPRQTPAGILGTDFLARYAIEVDVDRRTMSFYAPGEAPMARGDWTAVKLARKTFASIGGELLIVRGRVNGSKVSFILDLGIGTSLLNYEAADSLFANKLTVTAGRSMDTGTRLIDAFGDRRKLLAGQVRELTIGRMKWRRTRVWLYDAPLFKELNVQRLPYGLLGADLIADQDFTLDIANEKIYFRWR